MYQAQVKNRMHVVDSVEEVLTLWPFFVEGLEKMNVNFAGRNEIPVDVFFKLVVEIVNGGPEEGVVALFRSKNEKNVGFVVLRDRTETFFEKTAVVYACYSTGNNTQITRDMLVYAEQWARRYGYKSLYALSLRTGSAIKRLYTRKWRFRLYGLWFRKDFNET